MLLGVCRIKSRLFFIKLFMKSFNSFIWQSGINLTTGAARKAIYDGYNKAFFTSSLLGLAELNSN